jgi:hypothetical protein
MEGTRLCVSFAGFTAELKSEGDPDSRVQVAMFRAPIHLAHEHGVFGNVVGVRGEVFTSPNARASLVVEVGNTTRSFEAPYDQPQCSVKTWTLFDRNRFALSTAYPAKHPVTITLLMIVQRRNPDGIVRLSVGGLDLQAVTHARPARCVGSGKEVASCQWIGGINRPSGAPGSSDSFERKETL